MNESIRTSYIEYKKHSKDPLTLNQYVKVTEAFILFLICKIFDNFEVSLPFGLGSLRVRGVKENPTFVDGKIVGLSPNWRLTKELWDKDPEAKANKKLIYNMNEDTEGVRYKFFWSKNRILIPFKSLYSFRAARGIKRDLYTLIKNGEEFETIELTKT